MLGHLNGDVHRTKMHSPSREILQLAGVDEFSKGVPGVKKRSSWRGRRRKSENVEGMRAEVGR